MSLEKMLGHAHIKTIEPYAHASGFEDLAAALDRMD